MPNIRRPLTATEVKDIVVEVGIPCLCEEDVLRHDVNRLVELCRWFPENPSGAIEAINHVIADIKNTLRTISYYEQNFDLPQKLVETLTDAFLKPPIVKLPESIRAKTTLPSPALGELLEQAEAYYVERRAKWETYQIAMGGKRPRDPNRKLFVAGLSVVFEKCYQIKPKATLDTPFYRFLSAVLTRCERDIDPDSVHKDWRRVRRQGDQLAALKAMFEP